MPMSSDPATFTTHSPADFYAKHGGKPLTLLGSCYSSDGRRHDIAFCAIAGEITMKAATGTAPAVVVGQKLQDWGGRSGSAHFGHLLSHAGVIVSAVGQGDVWFCQTDAAFLIDTKT